MLSYAGSGYLLKTVVKLAAKPVSVIDGALPTADANSIGTLGGGIVGTAGMTYLWLRRRGVNAGAAGLGGWLPIFLNNATLAVYRSAAESPVSLQKSATRRRTARRPKLRSPVYLTGGMRYCRAGGVVQP